MTTIMPEGEKLRNAIKWISSELKCSEGIPLINLIEKASLQFNLSPKEEEYLKVFYKENKEKVIIIE